LDKHSNSDFESGVSSSDAGYDSSKQVAPLNKQNTTTEIDKKHSVMGLKLSTGSKAQLIKIESEDLQPIKPLQAGM
jgi:hypothetical protein